MPDDRSFRAEKVTNGFTIRTSWPVKKENPSSPEANMIYPEYEHQELVATTDEQVREMFNKWVGGDNLNTEGE